MPKIKITEYDRSGQVTSGDISNVVFVPVIGDTAADPKLYRSVAELQEDLASAGIDLNDLGYKLCKHLINIGFEVLVQIIVNSGDGNSQLTEQQWVNLQDKGLYDIRFLTNGVLKGIPAGMVSCAAKRGDAIALCNIDETQAETTADYYAASNIREQFSTIGSANGTYAAGFTPWFYTLNSDLADGTEPALIPAAFGYLFAYANMLRTYPEWYAVAGFDRGVIPELLSVTHDYSSADIEVLQARASSGEVELDESGDNVGMAINAIANIRPAGYIIWGNRTANPNSDTTGLTAQSFLNIRNMVSAIKKQIFVAARKYTFAPNNEALWINFQSYITPLLDRMQSGNGLLGYSFRRIKNNKKARLTAKLTVVPVEAVEDFEIDVILTDNIQELQVTE